MSFLMPKVKKPPPPKPTPTMADASKLPDQERLGRAYSSLISTTPSGLQRKASTAKRSLIGGGA